MIDAACGSAKMLLYECDQLIIDFDLDQGHFSFIERNELFRAFNINAGNNTHFLIDLFILSVINNSRITL
jgi:hypothetical protein